MTTNLILAITAFIIFLTYNIVTVVKFGMPSSLSDTFYLIENKKKNLGYIFTGMMWSMAFLLMPAWIAITDAMPGWEHYLTVLPFLSAAGIAFVGSAPAFRNVGVENKVHMWAAKLCAVFAIAWCAVVCWRIMYIIPIAIGIAWLIGWLLRKHTNADRVWTKCSDWIWEMAAFLATFTTVITEAIILL